MAFISYKYTLPSYSFSPFLPQHTTLQETTQTHLLLTQLLSNTPPAITLLVSGTPFQQSVWQALLCIPKGQTATYKAIAIQCGIPNATRAVGTAIGKNPISYLIPCHRVIRSDNTIGQYRWGKHVKQHLLTYEKAMPHQKTTKLIAKNTKTWQPILLSF